ncbi:hypothetical protein J4526_02430 [Desulfurococcaceae archaeon MEX13E-LK6-19]|nr:hypothetical protein J4526_02430 [Desulfurococcaceae archaeon MEX13E-LK6-19]
MGRRRKKYKRVIRRVRRIPTVFQCPHCGSRSLTIDFKKSEESGKKLAVIRCGNCRLKTLLEVPEIYETVDVYAKFLDAFTQGTIEIEFEEGVEETEGEELLGEEE